MGKHKLMTSSEQTFFSPFKKIKDSSNPVDLVGHQTIVERLYPQDQFNNNAKTRVSCITSTQTTAPRSCVFPANYTLQVGKLTKKATQKSMGWTLSPSCLFPPEKHNKNMEIGVSSHSVSRPSEQMKGEELIRTKTLCRREYATSGKKQSKRLLSVSKASKSKAVSQSPGVKSLLSLIEKTTKEISELRQRQQTLCKKQQPCSRVKDNANADPRFQGFRVDEDQKTSANEMRVDDTEE